MGKDLWEHSESVRTIVEQASQSTGLDLKDLLWNASEEDLKNTDKAQIAITTVNLSAATVLVEHGIKPDGVAGFSLGEYVALQLAGVFGVEDLFVIVKARGDAMAEASNALRSESGQPGMAAVLGLESEKVDELCRSRLADVYPANYNSPNQIVVSATAEGLAAAEAVFKEAGARRVIPLKVSGPFHSPLMVKAKERFAEFLASYEFGDPTVPIYSNVTGKRIVTGAEAKELCVAQIVNAVRWVDDEKAIVADGFERVVEAGPGKVLSGLWKSVGGEIPCLAAGTVEQIAEISQVGA